MKISSNFSSSCLNADEPTLVTVEDCENCSTITWSFTNKPDGAADPQVSQVGDSCTFSVTPSVAGSYTLKGECCADS